MDEDSQRSPQRSIVTLCLACDAADTEASHLVGRLGIVCFVCRSQDVKMAMAVSCGSGALCVHPGHHRGLKADLTLLNSAW